MEIEDRTSKHRVKNGDASLERRKECWSTELKP